MLAASYSTIRYQSSALKSRCFNRLRLLESSSWSGSNISRSISTAHHGFDYTKIMRKEPPEIDYLDYGLTRDCTQGDYQTFCEKFLMESEPTIEAFLKVFFSTPTVYNPEFLQKPQSESMLLEDRILKDEQQISNTLPFKALSDLSFKEYQIRMEEIPKAEMLKLIAQEYKNFKELFLQNLKGAGYITKGQMLTTLIDPNALKNCRVVNTEADVTHQFQSKLMTPIENVFELSGHSNVSIDQFYGIPLRDPKRTRYTKRADFGFVDNQLKRNLIIGEIEHHFDNLESEVQGAKELPKETLESITQCVRYCALSHCEYGFLTSLTETLLIQIDYDSCNYRTDDDIIQIRYYYLQNIDEKATMKALMMSILMKQLKNTESDNAQGLAYQKERSEKFLNFLLKSDRQFESDFQHMKNELTLKMRPIGETFTVYVDESIELSVDEQVLTFKIRKSDLISDAPDHKAEATIVRIFDPMTMNSPYDEIIDNIDFSRNCYLSELDSLEYLDGSSVNKHFVVEKGFIIIRDRLNNNVLASGQFIAYGDEPSSDIYSKQNISCSS